MTLDPFALLACADPIHTFSLERMLTDPRAFGLVNASNVQRAICRAMDGLPLGELATDPDVIAVFGGERAIASLPVGERPKEFVLLCGIRAGKSLISAACAVRAALTCNVEGLGPGEEPRVSIVSLTMKVARKTFRQHVRGRIMASPELRALLIGDPMADSLTLRHPTGRPVSIQVVAGAKAAGALIADWAAAVIFDEAPRMVGAKDGVVNLDDARASIAGRLLDDAQVVMPGSPWAPFGPIYELTQEHWGKPTRSLVVVRAKAYQMNPNIWTPEACAELKQRKPDAHDVDVECNFKAPDVTLLDAQAIELCATLEGEQPPNPLFTYVAVIDAATRSNAWTLLVMANPGDNGLHIAMARQWQGSSSRPLSPRTILEEIATLVKPYDVHALHSDQWSGDANKDLAVQFGLYLFLHTTPMVDKVTQGDRLKALITDRKLEMARVPLLVRDLGNIRKQVTQTGLAIEFPTTPDGRHCDFAAALLLGMKQPLPEPKPAPAEPTERDYAEQRKRELARKLEKTRRPWDGRIPG